MGRVLGGTVLILLAGTILVADETMAEDEGFLDDLDALVERVDDARANASAGDRSQAEDAIRAAQDRLRAANRSAGIDATGALDESLETFADAVADENATTAAVATQAVAIEAGTIDLLLTVSEEGNLSAQQVIRWLDEHLAAPGRASPPAAQHPAARDTHARQAAIDALLAARVLEEVSAAEALALQGNPGAEDHAERAQLVWEHAGGRIREAVDETAAGSMDRAMANLTDHLDDVQAGQSALAEVTGPLTAVGYHRSIDRIEAIAATIESAAFLAWRTMDTEPDHAYALFRDGEQLYRNHRAHVLRHGDRGTQPTDEAFQELVRAVQGGSSEALGEAVAGAAEELRESTSLDHGLRFTVQEVEPAAETNVRVPLGVANTGLEGIEAYRVVLAFDPEELTLTDVEPVWAQENTTVDRREGEVAIEASGPHAFGRTHLATLVTDVHAAEQPVTIEVLDARFQTPEGHPALIATLEEGTIVPDGGAAITETEADGHHDHHHGGDDHHGGQAGDATGHVAGDEDAPRDVPVGMIAAAALLLAVATRSRRGGPG